VPVTRDSHFANIRALADVEEISADVPRKRITVHGTGDQLRLAQFLVDEFDKPAPQTPTARHEFRLPGEGADLVRVFYLDHIRTPQEMQQASTFTWYTRASRVSRPCGP
jgi:hypothetical protein